MRHFIKIIIPTFLIFHLLVLSPVEGSFFICPALAQEKPEALWSTYGLVINDAQGNTPQEKPQICAADHGGYLVVWEDGRSGSADIYAQKIDESGQLLWGKDGLAVCNLSANQNSPRIISDSAGGAIVVWQDYRDGNANIYAQHLSAAGKPLWGTDCLLICKAEAGQFAPELVTDGAGGAIITWHDYRSGSGEDVYAQRVDSAGNILWQANGVPVSLSKGTQWYPQICSDGAGGAIISWADGRGSSLNNDIYTQHLDSTGQALWEKDGLPICEADGNQEKPTIVAVGDGVVVAWQDNRFKNIDIYAQKVAWDGKIRWDKDGVAVCTFPYNQENPRLVADGSGGALIVWTDQREENGDIYAQRLYSNGNIAWSENGRPLCKEQNDQVNPIVVKLKTEDWLVLWEDQVAGQNKVDLYAQKLNSSGTPLWDERGIPIATFRKEQTNATAALSTQGNIIVIWEDKRTGNSDLYGQSLSPEGRLLWGDTGTIICAAQGSVVQQNIQLAATPKGEVFVIFEDARFGFSNICAQKVTPSGTLAWSRNAIPVAKAAANQIKPCVIQDTKGGVYVAWEDYRLAEQPAIRLQKLGATGQPAWQSSLSVVAVKAKQTAPLMTGDNAGGVLVIWQDSRDVLSLDDLYGQRISPQGKLLWGDKGKSLISANGEQVEAAIIPDGSGGMFLTWTDYRRGDRNPDIYAQHINAKGDPVWAADGIQVCGAPDVQKNPQIVADGFGGVIIAWTDKGGGSYDIYAQRLDKEGKPLWLADGIPINQSSRTQQNCQLVNKRIVLWEDYRYGNWDVFGQAISPAGKLLWKNEGVPVASTPGTQYNPQALPWRNNSAIIVWEDYRNGQHYDLFMQRLEEDGKTLWEENGVRVNSRDGARAPKIITTPSNDSFYVFWEDYTDGGKAILGQRYLLY